MFDDAASSFGSSHSQRRERALRDARQRLKRLEIEAHRIKAELARLESENETELADELANEYRLDGVDTTELPGAVQHSRYPIAPAGQLDFSRPRHSSPRHSSQQQTDAQKRDAPQAEVAAAVNSNGAVRKQKPLAKSRRKFSPAWTLSLGVHAALLLLLAPMTFVMLSNERTPLFASMFDVSTDFDVIGEAPIELVSFEEFEMPEDAVAETAALVESVTEDFTPLDSEPGGETANNLGQLNTLPTDVGTLMAGGGAGAGGALGGGRRGAAGDEARLGTTSFFGTPAQANRVVFLVDNSGSMKQGRMETTIFELARSVEAMGEKQEFYVVFYSDQAYPMLYPNSVMEPLAATRENKERLYQWLQTVELCQGGKLIEAMEIAESLDPQVVYILSDGNISGTRTMERLAQSGERKFAVHTLGMGVSKPRDAQNLLMIAQANRGTFQMVRPLPAAIQSAKLHPIRSNGPNVAWGEGFFQPAR